MLEANVSFEPDVYLYIFESSNYVLPSIYIKSYFDVASAFDAWSP